MRLTKRDIKEKIAVFEKSITDKQTQIKALNKVIPYEETFKGKTEKIEKETFDEIANEIAVLSQITGKVYISQVTIENETTHMQKSDSFVPHRVSQKVAVKRLVTYCRDTGNWNRTTELCDWLIGQIKEIEGGII